MFGRLKANQAVLWCSFKCQGTPAVRTVKYNDEGIKQIYLCEPCYKEFIRNGPK